MVFGDMGVNGWMDGWMRRRRQNGVLESIDSSD